MYPLADVDPTRASTMTFHRGQVSRLRRLAACVMTWLMVLGLVLGLGLAAPAARALAAVPDAEALMTWAERTYPAWFPGPQTSQQWQGYTYRHYADTGNYLGVRGSDVYVLGPVAGSGVQPLRVGSLADFACRVAPAACGSSVAKPLGTFASAMGNTIYQHAQLRGVLLRMPWSSIEPRPGQFDFTRLDSMVATVKGHGLAWSLAIGAGGPGTPAWLMDELGVPFIAYNFRGTTPLRLPLAWDNTAQQRLAAMAQRLARQYGQDPALQLVYVSQMTANGIEGHLNGIDMSLMAAAGYSDERWVQASQQVAVAFAQAFADKPLAFEVHDINGSSQVPQRIIQGLWDDTSLGQRVGAAIWWLSGRTDYQAGLLDVLRGFAGDKYGQAIARSDEARQFGQSDYRTLFSQAQDLGLRYVELWEYDFGTGANTANGRWDGELKAFNDWAAARFGRSGQAAGVHPGLARPSR